MTTRRWMIAVAIVAVIASFGVEIERRRARAREELRQTIRDINFVLEHRRLGLRPWRPVPPDSK